VVSPKYVHLTREQRISRKPKGGRHKSLAHLFPPPPNFRTLGDHGFQLTLINAPDSHLPSPTAVANPRASPYSTLRLAHNAREVGQIDPTSRNESSGLWSPHRQNCQERSLTDNHHANYHAGIPLRQLFLLAEHSWNTNSPETTKSLWLTVAMSR